MGLGDTRIDEEGRCADDVNSNVPANTKINVTACMVALPVPSKYDLLRLFRKRPHAFNRHANGVRIGTRIAAGAQRFVALPAALAQLAARWRV